MSKFRVSCNSQLCAMTRIFVVILRVHFLNVANWLPKFFGLGWFCFMHKAVVPYWLVQNACHLSKLHSYNAAAVWLPILDALWKHGAFSVFICVCAHTRMIFLDFGWSHAAPLVIPPCNTVVPENSTKGLRAGFGRQCGKDLLHLCPLRTVLLTEAFTLYRIRKSLIRKYSRRKFFNDESKVSKNDSNDLMYHLCCRLLHR